MPRSSKRNSEAGRDEGAGPSRRRRLDSGSGDDDGDEFIDIGEHRFRSRLVQSRRWRTFRTDRRMMRIVYEGRTGGANQDSLSLDRTIYYLLKRMLDRIRQRHRAAGRPENSLVRLALDSGTLDFPVVTDMGPLFDNRVISSLLASMDRALTSRQHIDLENGFYLDIVVVDGPDKIRFFESAGGGSDAANPSTQRESEKALWKVPLPSKWTPSSVFGRSCSYATVPSPDFSLCSDNHPYRDACLLAAVVICLVFNAAMRLEKEGRKQWAALKGLNGVAPSRRKKAVSALLRAMDETVKHRALDLAVWRRCRFDALGSGDAAAADGGDNAEDCYSLRCELEKLQIRLVVTHDLAGYAPIFFHPSSGRTDHKELATVLLIRTLPDSETSHAVAVIRPEAFGSFLKGADPYCRFCLRTFAKQYVYRHRCQGLDGRCPMCLRIKARRDTYRDRFIQKLCCSPPDDAAAAADGGFARCDQCGVRCNSSRCLRDHQKDACPVMREAKWCGKCRRSKLHGVDADGNHDCELAFCRICKRHRSRKEHVCTMAKPSHQTAFSPLAFFDLETTVAAWESGDDSAATAEESCSHTINAVGLSFETVEKPGHFSEIYFYDDAMQHEEDGILREDCFTQVYWPPTMKYGERNFVRAKLPKSKTPRAQKVYEVCNRVDAAAGADGDDVDNDDDDDDADDDDPTVDGGKRRPTGQVKDFAGWESEEDEEPLPLLPLPLTAALESNSSSYHKGSAVDKFLAYILQPAFYGYTFLAHNAARFDSFLLIGRMVSLGYVVDPLFDGNKLLQLSIKSLKIRFIDSWRYIMLPLAKFPQRFPNMQLGAEDEKTVVGKGTFPYKFNIPSHYDYEGDLPPRRYFVDRFSTESAIESYEAMAASWAEGRKWCFKAEMHAYLAQDVKLLRGGSLCLLQEMLGFQETMFSESECRAKKTYYYLHPFSPPYFSKSTFTHSLWQEFGMEEDTLTLLTNQKNARKTSAGEQEWLSFLNWKRETGGEEPIRTAHNHPEGQACVEGYFPDGADLPNRQLYEYAGCIVHYHGGEEAHCPLSSHLLPSHASPFSPTCRQAYARWETKLRTLRSAGYGITVMWECEFNALKKTSPELAAYLKDQYYGEHRPRQRLAARHGLRGGRCESFRLVYQKQAAERR